MNNATEEASDETVVVDATPAEDPTAGRQQRLDKLSRNHIAAAMGVGLIPIPLVDVLALMGVQLDLIKKLAAEYDIPFERDRGKSIVTSLVGGLLTMELGLSLSSLIKCIPLIGQTTGAVTMPIMAGGATYAIHKVFVQHFESGGTFLDLDPAKVKTYFSEQFTKGKKVATDLKQEPPVNGAV